MRVLRIAVALALLWFVVQGAAELFVAWYSGGEPEASTWRLVQWVASLVVMLVAAGLVAWPQRRN